MRDSTILFKYHIHLRNHSTDKSGQEPFFDHLASLQNSLGALCSMWVRMWGKSSISACLMTFREERRRKGRSRRKESIFSSKHNFTVCFAIHTIFKLVLSPCISRSCYMWMKHFLMPIPRISAIMVLCYTCWQKVDDEENIIWHFPFPPPSVYHVPYRRPSKDTNVHFLLVWPLPAQKNRS